MTAPRYDFPGAIHHTCLKTLDDHPAFESEFDREMFLRLLGEYFPWGGARSLSYAFMRNHFHNTTSSGRVSISRVTQRVAGPFAKKHNWRVGRRGYVFRNRFWSKLVKDESYLTELIRYVNSNPTRAGVLTLAELEHSPLTSYPALLGNVDPPRFLDIDAALRPFGSTRQAARAALRRWMEEGLADPEHMRKVEKHILDRSVATLGEVIPEEDAPSECEKPTARDVLRLLEQVAATTGASLEDLEAGRKTPACSETRALTSHLAADTLGASHYLIAGVLGISKQAVAKAIHRGRELARGARREEVGKLSYGESRGR